MAEKIDLKELEKKAYKLTFQDGFWDIFIGMIFMAFALMPLGDVFGLPEMIGMLLISLGWNIGAVVFMILGKKYVTVPRIGMIKFGPKRKADQRKVKIYLGINVLFGVVVLLMQMTGNFGFITIQRFALSILLGLFISLPFGVMAYFLDFPRLYIYALLGGLGFFLIDVFELFTSGSLSIILVFGIMGGSIVIVGIVFLIKFLRKYPLPKETS